MREIYIVYAAIVDANGTYNALSGYPKTFDSKHYNDDTDKTYSRALGDYYSVLGAMCTRDDRKLQFATILRASDGMQMMVDRIGDLDKPEPEPEEVEQS